MTGRRSGASTSFDSEPERTFLRLRREAKEKRVVGAEEEEEHFEEYFEPNMEENMENHHEEEAHNHCRGGRENHAGEDRRVLEAASKVIQEGFAKIILVGNKEQIERDSQEFNLDIIFDHCTEGHLIAKELGKWKAKAVVGPTLTGLTKPEVSHKSFETPKVLMDEGCVVAFTTDYPIINIEALNVTAAMAVKYGLDEDKAIKALTENAAFILGLDKRLGKLETGYDADVVVWDGHPLDTRSKTEYVFIDGEKVLEKK